MDNIKKEKTAYKRNGSNNTDIADNSAFISADEQLGGSRLSIKETLIWLEESKVFFYKIKKQIESDNEKNKK